MEQAKPIKVTKTKPKMDSYVSLRLKRDTKRRLLMELTKANKKDLGRKIKSDELLNLALSLIETKHILDLREKSLSNTDRLDRQYHDYSKQHGPISKDDFLGRLMRGELSKGLMPIDIDQNNN